MDIPQPTFTDNWQTWAAALIIVLLQENQALLERLAGLEARVTALEP